MGKNQNDIYEKTYECLRSFFVFNESYTINCEEKLKELKECFTQNAPLTFINGEKTYKDKRKGLISMIINYVNDLEQSKEILNIILKKEKGKEWLQCSINGQSPLISSVFFNSKGLIDNYGIPFVKYLIEQSEVLQTEWGKLEGGSALYSVVRFGACDEAVKERVKFLISCGADIGYRHEWSNTFNLKPHFKMVFDDAAPEIKELIRFEGLKYLFKQRKDDDDILRRIKFLLDNEANPGAKKKSGKRLIDSAAPSIRVFMLSYMNRRVL